MVIRRPRRFALLIGLWALVAMKSADFPARQNLVWDAAVVLFSDPFYSNGPNDQGIGWNILSSLKRVAIGFGVAALVGIRWVSSSAASPS